MLFEECTGSYYRAVAAILALAVQGSLTENKIHEIVNQQAFGDSNLTIPDALTKQKWPLLQHDMTTPLQHVPTMPLNTLQKRWLKALLQDPRVRLFDPPETGLEDVEPLYQPGAFVRFDRALDGDPFEDPDYIKRFHLIRQALKEKRKLHVQYLSQRGNLSGQDVIPCGLEYSPKDDKFRLICFRGQRRKELNLARMRGIKLLDPYLPSELPATEPKKEKVVFDLYDQWNAPERVLLHFSDLEKETERLSPDHYKVTMYYRQSDETEILIRLLSFGPAVKVTAPKNLVDRMKQRVADQMKWNTHFTTP